MYLYGELGQLLILYASLTEGWSLSVLDRLRLNYYFFYQFFV